MRSFFGGPLIIAPPSSSSCSKVLDDLDTVFNMRRDARRTSTRITHGHIELFDLYEPEAICFSDERFGQGKAGRRYEAFGDGPKFVCGIDLLASKKGDCLVYSVGSFNQVDFEVSVKEYLGCETHTFDPIIDTFVGDEYATFHQWGLGEDGKNESAMGFEYTAMSLETIYQKLGHKKEKRKIDILKIDCEACEWTVMPPIFAAIASGNLVVDQIQIEVHNSRKSLTEKTVKAFFEAADAAKMRIFHKERNHWGCGGWSCLEYAFASESFLREANSKVMSCGK
jgi:hypothetical protein